MNEAEESNFVEKVWLQVRKHTRVNESDSLPLKLFKWSLLFFILSIGVILSPVIIVVLIFAFMISI